MDWGSPMFVLAIIGMAMAAGVLKSWGRAAHGIADRPRGKKHMIAENSAELANLRQENARLTDRLEAYEDRLIVLEKIVTDSGFDVAHQIESLRDRDYRLEDRSKA